MRASDEDEGVNGEVVYAIHPPLSDHKVSADYYIDAQMGLIYAERDLDMSEGSSSRLAIVSNDQAADAAERRYAK